ncbi:hypothetical protein [Sulfolobus monocaudavirus SMV4]|uniref:hypothetical protein n=1 Tax=Sulfolobus monocaudavirus SMV4 TaxID=1732178 RepID=UPI000706CAB0|nr:hypothetical protein AVT99_gp65 [Sulfolobus monocaudavirus SMV4]ALG97089.1 hypothetical protein [Sulfolobus monocaudavirus SMV4]
MKRGYRKKIKRVKTHNHDIHIYSFPWECYKVREISDEVYELYQADCNDPEAKRKSRTTVTINVKKRGIYNVLVFPEKIVVKLAKEERRYNVTSLLFLPKKVYDLQFDDENLILKYVYPSEKVGTVKIKLMKPIVFERDKKDHYSIIKFWKPEDYQLLKKEILEKVEVHANK